MTAQQRIVRVRRNYNQWVANQTLEDYALRFTAKSARKWSSFAVANTAIGAVSFLALEAIGGSITVNYGFINANRLNDGSAFPGSGVWTGGRSISCCSAPPQPSCSR